MDCSNPVWILTIHIRHDGDVEVIFVWIRLHFVTIDDCFVIVSDSDAENVSSMGKECLLVFEILDRIISCSGIILQDMSWGKQVMVIDGHCCTMVRGQLRRDDTRDKSRIGETGTDSECRNRGCTSWFRDTCD